MAPPRRPSTPTPRRTNTVLRSIPPPIPRSKRRVTAAPPPAYHPNRTPSTTQHRGYGFRYSDFASSPSSSSDAILHSESESDSDIDANAPLHSTDETTDIDDDDGDGEEEDDDDDPSTLSLRVLHSWTWPRQRISNHLELSSPAPRRAWRRWGSGTPESLRSSPSGWGVASTPGGSITPGGSVGRGSPLSRRGGAGAEVKGNIGFGVWLEAMDRVYRDRVEEGRRREEGEAGEERGLGGGGQRERFARNGGENEVVERAGALARWRV